MLRASQRRKFKYIFNREIRYIFTKIKYLLYQPLLKRKPPRFTFIAASYNVEKYLDDFFKSIIVQEVFLERIQLIIVDDGSTDSTKDIVKKWKQKFHNIEYYYKENGGQASARNFGLLKAKGEWVTFMDPDDFISHDYISSIDKHIKDQEDEVALISTNFIFFHENGFHFSDTHPLKYRYQTEKKHLKIRNMGKLLQLSVNNAFFKRKLIMQAGLQFMESCKPTFEDANFVAKFLIRFQEKEILFLKEPRYLYRKRKSGNSTLDLSIQDKRVCLDVLEYGLLNALEYANNQIGYIPIWLQRTCLYHLMWLIRGIYTQIYSKTILNDSEKKIFFAHLENIFSCIQEEVIWDFELAGISETDKIGLCSLFKKGMRRTQKGWVQKAYQDTKRIFITYNSAQPGDRLKLKTNLGELLPISSKVHYLNVFGRPYNYRILAWFDLGNTSEFSLLVNDKEIELGNTGSRGRNISSKKILHFLYEKQKVKAPIPFKHKIIRFISNLKFIKNKYGNSLVLMDRDIQADDNAEHLYRYINKHTNENIFFALSRKSRHWNRLKEGNYKLINYGTWKYLLAILNCRALISSHIDGYIYDYPLKRYYKDKLNKRKFIFLQHGVIVNDISKWLNWKNDLDLIITTTPQEYKELAVTPNQHLLTSSQVALTGLARFDSLLEKSSKKPSKKRIIIAPTWRPYLSGMPKRGSSSRRLNKEFSQSNYFKNWDAILSNRNLSEALSERGFTLTFFPHPNTQPYLYQFNTRNGVGMRTYSEDSVQEILADCYLLITDYSSIAFDAAYIYSPVIYFQFDKEEFFTKGILREGYFDYQKDGFGPVCQAPEDVVQSIIKMTEKDYILPSSYKKNIFETFPYRDGKCCERIYHNVKNLVG